MQAALWYGPEQIKIEEVEVPTIGPDEVLVKIGTALTCGTDFKLFRQGHALLVKDVPSPFGHELAGTISEVGSAVEHRFQVGDRVVAANSAPCDYCFFCDRQQFNLCENLEFLNGAYAEYIRIPAQIVRRNLYTIPDFLSFREAALTEPLACVLHCAERMALKADETLCIIGAGTCGLLFTQLAKLNGTRVIVLGRGEEKLNVAKELGADHIISIQQEGYQEEIKSLTNGYGPDKVIDVVGQPHTWELATELVRKGGQVWFYGGCPKETKVTLDTHRLHYGEISCHGVFHHTPHYFAKSLEMIAERQIKTKPLIGGEARLSDLNQIFQKGMAGNPLKIAVIP
ncbi:MAG: hypothetical protein A2W61_02095 [Deltaproteobacteria bacterium RIFCSPLOWO2_01_44_7]|nr:MAG: hypothetical protein A2712_11080 [Deltaproteobacteria bacterium RIFCSPHIGHO2_01_FULL_43_49]OGQ16610.1 MAG: hypothetical protein A3D22_06780 [Deltaproteobacteria bacterium RIFCSPHIGHO2_02_FULL_44_53]OGQ28425.1 MAG: hypothetical protein A3D98_06485 [Deltaproteobacteria bacterium RIFCSPHIGHO2_12_FULL_44_21]OGQ32498.1 MAG: hypothetical protein A2979_11045 [Deltaproteobacteria bacterium RIFCSPLOWO2_01_FULL_45_74]OGQ41623.1 MAG: hypothetical protein A3I70_05390 [Deltaproteobacteria bacterium 